MGRHNPINTKERRKKRKQLKKLEKLRHFKQEKLKKLDYRKNYFCNVDTDAVSSGTNFSTISRKDSECDSQATIDVVGTDFEYTAEHSSSPSEKYEKTEKTPDTDLVCQLITQRVCTMIHCT